MSISQILKLFDKAIDAEAELMSKKDKEMLKKTKNLILIIVSG